MTENVKPKKIMEDVKQIGFGAEKCFIPSMAKKINQYSYRNNYITELNFEGTQIIVIEKYAFSRSVNLENVTFPSSLEEISEGAFFECISLKHIEFHQDSNLRKIGKDAFYGCEQLVNFKFPSKIESIGESAFKLCANVTVFDLRETMIRHIGKLALLSMTGSRVYFPPTITTRSVMLNWQYNRIEIDELHPYIKRDECGYFFSNGTILLGDKTSRHVLIRHGIQMVGFYCFYESRIASLTIPSSVTKISSHSFDNCVKLRKIRFANNSRLEIIGKFAFSDCCSLNNVKLPKLLKIIKFSAFNTCQSLQKIVFHPDSQLERIECAFQYTGIKNLSLPPSIREMVFTFQCMINLQSVYVNNDYFKSNTEGTAIISKDGSELIWALPNDQYEIPEGVRIIKKYAFYSYFNRLIIPTSVEIIEDDAFDDHINVIEFSEGSKLKSIYELGNKIGKMIISNEHFATKEDGSVISLATKETIFRMH